MKSIRNAALDLGCLMIASATIQTIAASAQDAASNPSLAARIADGMCLKPAMLMPERCVVLSATSRGFTGTRDGATVFTLER